MGLFLYASKEAKTLMQKLFAYYFVIINVVTFLLFALDKYKAVKKQQRISEKKLYIYALFGGVVGGVLSMVFFRHKIQKQSFMLKYYFIILLWISIVYSYFFYFNRLNFLE